MRLTGADVPAAPGSAQALAAQAAAVRDRAVIATDLTGADSEQELLTREMERDMVASIVRRIDGASRQP